MVLILFSNLFVYFLLAHLWLRLSFWRVMIPPGTPRSLPHTFPLAIRNYHTVRVVACPKATEGLMFLAWLLSDMPGKGKERKWVDQPLSIPPKQAWEKPAQCFFDSAELVREYSPSGSNKSCRRLRGWNCLTCTGMWSLIVALQNNGEDLPSVLSSEEGKTHTSRAQQNTTKLTDGWWGAAAFLPAVGSVLHFFGFLSARSRPALAFRVRLQFMCLWTIFVQ